MSDGDTRESWNRATRNHNAHKGDQAAFLRAGGDVLFPEELSLLGDIGGKRLVHLQCNSGQDSLCLARLGASVTGVDFSDEAIRFARTLSNESGIAASFEQAEIVEWMSTTSARFDVAFASYGALGWIRDLDAWMRGAARILDGGALVIVEFHPVVWSVDKDLRLGGDDYFSSTPFVAPVDDYVAASGAGLGAVTEGRATTENTVPATSWQHTLARTLQAVIDAGLAVEKIEEWPYANGCRVNPALELGEGRRWHWPNGAARVPLMWGVRARRR